MEFFEVPLLFLPSSSLLYSSMSQYSSKNRYSKYIASPFHSCRWMLTKHNTSLTPKKGIEMLELPLLPLHFQRLWRNKLSPSSDHNSRECSSASGWGALATRPRLPHHFSPGTSPHAQKGGTWRVYTTRCQNVYIIMIFTSQLVYHIFLFWCHVCLLFKKQQNLECKQLTYDDAQRVEEKHKLLLFSK